MKAFVIMPFRPEMDSLYREVIVPAGSASGFHVVRADEILEGGPIPQQIINAIQDSVCVLAEISLQNDNVFYELGYAHALRKETILISNMERPLPFDVRVSRVIIYDPDDPSWKPALTEKLRDRMEYLVRLSNSLQLDNLKDGQELQGHMHTLSGRLLRFEPWQHFWFFARREDLDTWWPQDNGEVDVRPDGTWKAQLFLGNDIDSGFAFDLRFGLVETRDSRDLAELCVNRRGRDIFPTVRQLPHSFQELAHVRVKRVR